MIYSKINAFGFYLTTDNLQTTLNETDCSCEDGCGFNGLKQELVDKFYTFESRCSFKIHVSCANRCYTQNKKDGGSYYPHPSLHLIGGAIDTRPVVQLKENYQEFMEKSIEFFNGIGYYNYMDNNNNKIWFFHLDVRETPLYWTCKQRGVYNYTYNINELKEAVVNET